MNVDNKTKIIYVKHNYKPTRKEWGYIWQLHNDGYVAFYGL